MTNMISANEKINSVLSAHTERIHMVFQDTIRELADEVRKEEATAFRDGFTESCLKIEEIEFNPTNFDMLLKILAIYDDLKNRKSFRFDEFANIAAKNGIRSDLALIVFAACKLNIEGLRTVVHENLYKVSCEKMVSA